MKFNESQRDGDMEPLRGQQLWPDRQLIDAIKEGDTHAFDSLVTRYQGRIQKIVGRYVRDPSEGKDVCQEVFIKAFRAMGKFRGDSSFYTWIYRIAINTAKNYLVAQGRRLPDLTLDEESMSRFLAWNLPKEQGTPERLLLRDEIEHILNETIAHLPQDLRTAILLREMDGLTYEEIADKMHCPIGTVRSRIFRARAVIDSKVQPFIQQ